MAKTRILMKRLGNYLIPDPGFIEEFNSAIKNYAEVWVEFFTPRNLRFHKKFFAMMNFAFENWEPVNDKSAKIMGLEIKKDFETFREDVIILAGYHSIVFKIDGSFKYVADSISFAKMNQDRFEKLYSACAQVLLDLVFKSKMTREEMDRIVEELLRF